MSIQIHLKWIPTLLRLHMHGLGFISIEAFSHPTCNAQTNAASGLVLSHSLLLYISVTMFPLPER